ncbi:hypothetical protein RIF29_29462 [Crotalaria pallida]|uniref:Uncharacterized protein n=1 Tax=Crotalaria pallida TaxID=3830 RepID=A0AAN9HXH9_CROPI
MAINNFDRNESSRRRPSTSSMLRRTMRLRLSAGRARARTAIKALYASLMHMRLVVLNIALSQISSVLHDFLVQEQASTSSYHHVSSLYEAWILEQNKIFLIGLINYYRRRVSEMAWNLMLNSMPPPMHSYPESVLRHQPSTYLSIWHNLNQLFHGNMAADLIRTSENLMVTLKLIYNRTDSNNPQLLLDQIYLKNFVVELIRRFENFMATPNMYFNQLIPNEQQPLPNIFKEDVPLVNKGNMMSTNRDEVDLDLELRLGLGSD